MPFKFGLLVAHSFVWMLLSGCSTLYKPVGGTLNAYSEDVAIGEFLKYQDVDLLCQSGGSLLPLIASFEAVGTTTNKTVSTLFLLGGFCAVQKAHELEIQQLLANQQANYDAALNFSVLKKRALAVGAMRQLGAYHQVVDVYPAPEGACPAFAKEQDELLFLLGNLQGLEALLNDGKSGLMANVPRNIANAIYRAMNCLDNGEWWGVPQAVQAALLVFLPNLDLEQSKKVDAVLLASVKIGRASGVPLAETVALAAWEGRGDNDKVSSLIKEHFIYSKDAVYSSDYLSIVYISNRHLENKNDVLRLESNQSLTADPGEPFLKADVPAMDIDLDDI